MNILADVNIPGVTDAFEKVGRVRCMPGRAIRRTHLQDVDILLVRSVTSVDEQLLQDTPVKFIGTATAGYDHIDHAYMCKHDIKFAHAPGANAVSVAEYVCAALLFLSTTKNVSLTSLNLGVVGCGNVGGQVAHKASALGLSILACDPPLKDEGLRPPRDRWYDWEETVRNADILSLHVPLSHEGPYRTTKLVDSDTLTLLGEDSWLINTSRGGVVDSADLTTALRARQINAAVLDVWEHEPAISPELLHLVDLATPHIAGYSYDGKLRGTQMLYNAVMEWLGRTPAWSPEDFLEDLHPQLQPPDPADAFEVQLDMLVRQMYDIRLDDANLRRIGGLPEAERGKAFSELRKTYRKRRSFEAFELPDEGVDVSVREAFNILAGHPSKGR